VDDFSLRYSMPKVTKSNAKKALINTMGNVSAAARALRVTGATLRCFLKKHPDIQEIVEEQREELADMAESQLYNAVLAGEPWAIRLALLNHAGGRRRGYSATASVEEETGTTPGVLFVPVSELNAAEWEKSGKAEGKK
jgi:hypothetical protein